MNTNPTSAKMVFRGAMMMVSLFVLAGQHSFAQTFMWATRYGAATKQESASSIARDNSGNVYVAGVFYNTSITLGSVTLTKADATYPDIFVAKYNSAGVVQWAKRAGGSSTESGPLVSVDASGNVFLAGSSASTSMTVDNLTLGSAYGGGDMFIAKFNSSGVAQWTKRAGGNNSDSPSSLKIDGNGNVYAFGTYRGSNITFGTTVLTNGHSGQDELFLVKYDTNGGTVWAVSGIGANVSTTIAAGSGLETARSMDIDAQNNIYIGGHFACNKLGFQSLLATNGGAEGSYDIFLAKFNDAGIVQWLKREGGNGNEYLTDLAQDNQGRFDINGSFNNIYNAYSFTIGTTLLSAPQSVTNTFLAQYSSNTGTNNWVNAGRTQSEAILRTDSIGNIYVTGRYATPCNDVALATTDLAVYQYNSNGSVKWIKKFSGSSTGNNIKDFLVSKYGNLVMIGEMLSNTMTFGSVNITKSDAIATNIDFYISSMHGLNMPVVAASPNLNIFTGQTASLSTNSATSYTWSTGATTASISAGAGTYSVTTSDGISNSATSCPVTVVSSALPTITASGPTSFCDGGSVILTASSGGSSYLWSNGATTQAITATASGSYTVTVTYSNGSSATSAATTVTANPYPVVAAITGNANVCEGGSTTQLSNSTAGGVWTSFNTALATISSTGLVTGVAAGPMQVQYTVTSAAGCVSSVGKTINVMSTYNSSNNSLFTYSGGSTGYNWVCLGPNATRAVLFKVTLDNPVSGYYPKLSSITVRRNQVSGQDYNNHDSICVYYTSNPNITDVSLINNQANQIGNAFADYTLIGSNFTIALNNGGLCVSPGTHYIYIVAYEAANSSGQGFDAWNGNSLAGSPAPTTNTTIEYKLQTFNYGCSGGQQYSFNGAMQTCTRRISSTCASTARMAGNLNNDGTQLDGTAYTPQLELSCYPNPFNDKTTFRFSTEESGSTRLLITDMTGRLIKEVFSGYLSAGLEQELEFDGSLLPAGMYFYSLSCGSVIRTGKMIINK